MKKNNNKIREIHIPTAKNTLKETEPKIIIQWLDKISEAKRNGSTSCYLCANNGAVSKNAVEKFLKAGYDINYEFFDFEGSWFVKAFWHDGCNGRLYDEGRRKYVDVDTMFNL